MLKSAQFNPSSHKDELLMFVSSPRRCYSPVLCPERTPPHAPAARWLSHGADSLTASLPVRFLKRQTSNTRLVTFSFKATEQQRQVETLPFLYKRKWDKVHSNLRQNQWRESFTCDHWWTSKAGSNTSLLMSPQPEEEVLRQQWRNTAWQEWILHVST